MLFEYSGTHVSSWNRIPTKMGEKRRQTRARMRWPSVYRTFVSCIIKLEECVGTTKMGQPFTTNISMDRYRSIFAYFPLSPYFCKTVNSPIHTRTPKPFIHWNSLGFAFCIGQNKNILRYHLLHLLPRSMCVRESNANPAHRASKCLWRKQANASMRDVRSR